MRIRFLPILLVAVALPACGSTNTPIAATPVPIGDALKEIGETYKYIAAQKQQAPRKADDLAEYSGSLEGALPLIRSGEIVVVWGVGYSSGSNQILAHGKDAASNGGPVLLRNGTVKEMTATEFAASKK